MDTSVCITLMKNITGEVVKYKRVLLHDVWTRAGHGAVSVAFPSRQASAIAMSCSCPTIGLCPELLWKQATKRAVEHAMLR